MASSLWCILDSLMKLLVMQLEGDQLEYSSMHSHCHSLAILAVDTSSYHQDKCPLSVWRHLNVTLLSNSMYAT